MYEPDIPAMGMPGERGPVGVAGGLADPALLIGLLRPLVQEMLKDLEPKDDGEAGIPPSYPGRQGKTGVGITDIVFNDTTHQLIITTSDGYIRSFPWPMTVNHYYVTCTCP